MKRLLFLVIFTLCFCRSLFCEVETHLGKINGKLSDHDSDEICEYLGIPYAEPPIGSNRFKSPVAIQKSWNETFNATSYGAACMQSPNSLWVLTRQFSVASTTNERSPLADDMMSEDCLFLNIYAPNRTVDNLAVMIYIHGGEFIEGTGVAYKGALLSGDHDVIVVNLNYRLGAFGFLYNGEDMKGNFGIMDQQLAVQWVKENIAAFGGDPNRITLFGEGAGGSSVHLHTLMPDPMFRNAIVQSASYNDAIWSQNRSQDNYNAFMGHLRKLPNAENETDAFLLSNESAQSLLVASYQVGSWSPTLNENMLLEDPSSSMQDIQNKDINIISGFNRQNIIATPALSSVDWARKATEDIIVSAFPECYNNLSDTFLDQMTKNYLSFYGVYESDYQSMTTIEKEEFIKICTTDQIFTTWPEEISYANSELSKGNVYQYEFLIEDELSYLFGYRDDNKLLVKEMQIFWSNFAKSGNPNEPVNVTQDWKLYNSSALDEADCRLKIMLDNSKISPTTRNEILPRSLTFWDKYYWTLGFSCSHGETSKIIDDDSDEEIPVGECEPTVAELFGLTMSNETAGILMFVFISLTSFFVLIVVICLVCLCHMKRKLKKACKKKVENLRGFDNPGTSECKL